jgi:hypothetical protein
MPDEAATTGFVCASCGSGLVTTTRRPARGLVVRYRRCENPECAEPDRLVTRERVAKVIRPGDESYQ